jgi:hypothetical protein
VTALPTRIAALFVVAGMIAGAGGSALASMAHPVCTAHDHDCGAPARLADPCCGDAGTPPDATPAQSRIEVTHGASAAVPLPVFACAIPPLAPARAVRTSPSRTCLLDLPTLFATLLL